MQRVAKLTEHSIPESCAVGVTLLENGRWSTAAWTHAWLVKVDKGQYDLGDGPCLRAAVEQRIVRADEQTLKAEWGPFYEDAVANDVRSVFAAPLMSGDGLVGAMNIYFAEPDGALGLPEETIAHYATQASVTLANSRVYKMATLLAEQLQEAMRSRAEIEQAKGWLMGTQGIDADTAFDVLRKESQRSNRKLRDVARAFITRR